ncbi:MAG: acyltransferase family protein [Oscillospiraceae bacterium]|nr:acyltransferase family protein [Oscillospiraceae bacterium]
MDKKRIVYFDHLRVAAIVAVMVLHVSAQNWNEVDPISFQWNISNLYNGLVRWCVPVLLMISGSLFLKRDIPTKTLYSKYILRLAIAYLAWSAFYAVLVPLGRAVLTGDPLPSLKLMVTYTIAGDLHTWFLPMIIGIYMCIPLIRQIVASKTTTRYFLILSFLFAFVLPQMISMARDLLGDGASSILDASSSLLSDMNMDMVTGYSFYFVLGYVLDDMVLTKKQRTIIYCLGVAGVLSSVGLNAWVTWITQAPCSTYHRNSAVGVLLAAVCVHTWCKYRPHHNEKLNSWICKLSRYSFGAYLIHVFVMDTLERLGLDTLCAAPVITIPAISLLTAIGSFAISFVLNKIPVIRRWLV